MPADESRLKLYLAHRAQLIDYATPIVGCPAHAEDVVQEAYTRFAPAPAVVNQPASYLYRIVRNLALDLKRSLVSETRRNAMRAESIDAAVPSPEEHAYYRDELRKVEEALATLPPKVKLAFQMHRLGGMTFEQIGQRLNVSTATAARWSKEAFNQVSELVDSSGR